MVIVITGLLLSGKSTLKNQLVKWGYPSVLEYTTRPKRDGEVDGVDNHFISDEEFDKIEMDENFINPFHVNTVHGLWKYGTKKEDMKDGHVLVCGPAQMVQILESGIPILSVLLDIDEHLIFERADTRGDDKNEVRRRFEKDLPMVEKIRNKMDLVLDASKTVEENAIAVDSLAAHETGGGYHRVLPDGRSVITAQQLDDSELNLYLVGNHDLIPYLRMYKRGMPHDQINQIAWLLLNGGGCAFCKVCRKEPCNIKDDETCTKNIADYIRDCVHAEDVKRMAQE